MSVLVETPFKLTLEETLCSAAATLCLLELAKIGTPILTIADMCFSPQYGFTASASLEQLGPRFVRITDIKGGTIDWNTVPFCDCPNPDSYELGAGDILIARSGSIGKSFIVTNVPETAVFASYMIRLRIKPDFASLYVYWCLQSQQFWQQITEAQRGSAMNNINGKMLSSLRFPAPSREVQDAIANFLNSFRKQLSGRETVQSQTFFPSFLHEQQRIVVRIEELAAKIEEARGLRREAVETLNGLIASSSNAIFKPHPGWTEAYVRDFCDHPQYGYTESATTEPIGPRFLRITDIQNGQVNWNNVPFCRCPNPEQYLLKENDLVFARTGATTGKSFLIRDCPEAIFASYLIRLRVKRLVSAEYLYRYFQTPSYWTQITNEKKGTGQPNVNGAKLANIRVPIPPGSMSRDV